MSPFDNELTRRLSCIFERVIIVKARKKSTIVTHIKHEEDRAT